MARKEVYATSGTRLVARVFGGYDFTAKDLERSDFAANRCEDWTLLHVAQAALAGDLEPLDQLSAPSERRFAPGQIAIRWRKAAAAVVVLHVFQKKAKSGTATPKQDMELIRQRLTAAEQFVKEL